MSLELNIDITAVKQRWPKNWYLLHLRIERIAHPPPHKNPVIIYSPLLRLKPMTFF